jgi:hypothetical protein
VVKSFKTSVNHLKAYHTWAVQSGSSHCCRTGNCWVVGDVVVVAAAAAVATLSTRRRCRTFVVSMVEPESLDNKS